MLVNNHNIASLSDEELLSTRICDIRISVRDVPLLQSCYLRLRQELKRKGLLVAPMIWASDEWYSPDGVCGFAVPFFLLHPRLIRLAEHFIFEAEGCESDWCMRLMRHEMGHVMDNAYLLRRRRQRQKLFGLSSIPYPESYAPQPYSHKYVRNLDSWYAQAHPDEDWAETFAVWLNPQSKWRARYPTGEARAKLDYMNEVMKSLVSVRPPRINKQVDMRARDIKKTLVDYFSEQQTQMDFDETGFFDQDLKRIFSEQYNAQLPLSAAKFINNYKNKVREHICRWTGYDRHKVSFVLDHVGERCDQLELFLRYNQEETLLGLTAMLAAKTASFLATGVYKISL